MISRGFFFYLLKGFRALNPKVIRTRREFLANRQFSYYFIGPLIKHFQRLNSKRRTREKQRRRRRNQKSFTNNKNVEESPGPAESSKESQSGWFEYFLWDSPVPRIFVSCDSVQFFCFAPLNVDMIRTVSWCGPLLIIFLLFGVIGILGEILLLMI